jgi:4-amino-4-deoxy-L-arabinose transferase-like glycosyltransferase
MLLVYCAMLLPGLGRARIHHTDEIRAAERAREIAIRRDPFAVTENWQPNFAKPPLQYWMQALAIQRWGPGEFQVRIWSVLYGCGCLLATAALAQRVAPEAKWVGIAAPFFFCLNSSFLAHSRSGMLDTGQLLFCLLVYLFAWKAQGRAWWWLAAGASAGVGCLQKSPMPAAIYFAMGVLPILQSRRSGAATFLPYVSGLSLALLPSLLWTLVQWKRFGATAPATSYQKEVLGRFSEFAETWNLSPVTEYLISYATSWRAIGLAGAILLLCAPFTLRRTKADLPASIVAGLILIHLLVLGVIRPVYPRYLLAVIPMIAVFLAVMISRLPGRWWWKPLIVLVLSLLSLPTWPPRLTVPDQTLGMRSDQIRSGRYLRGVAPASAQIFWVDQAAGKTPAGINWFLFYLDAARPVTIATPAKAIRLLPTAVRRDHPVYGVSPRAEYASLQVSPLTIKTISQVGDLIIWQATPRIY